MTESAPNPSKTDPIDSVPLPAASKPSGEVIVSSEIAEIAESSKLNEMSKPHELSEPSKVTGSSKPSKSFKKADPSSEVDKLLKLLQLDEPLTLFELPEPLEPFKPFKVAELSELNEPLEPFKLPATVELIKPLEPSKLIEPSESNVSTEPPELDEQTELTEASELIKTVTPAKLADSAEPVKQNQSEDTGAVQKFTGRVIWFNIKRAFGFILRNDVSKLVFVHQTAIIKNNPKKNVKSLADGENVEFNIVRGKKGDQAINVTGPNGATVIGSSFAADRLPTRIKKAIREVRARQGLGLRRGGHIERGGRAGPATRAGRAGYVAHGNRVHDNLEVQVYNNNQGLSDRKYRGRNVRGGRGPNNRGNRKYENESQIRKDHNNQLGNHESGKPSFYQNQEHDHNENLVNVRVDQEEQIFHANVNQIHNIRGGRGYGNRGSRGQSYRGGRGQGYRGGRKQDIQKNEAQCVNAQNVQRYNHEGQEQGDHESQKQNYRSGREQDYSQKQTVYKRDVQKHDNSEGRKQDCREDQEQDTFKVLDQNNYETLQQNSRRGRGRGDRGFAYRKPSTMQLDLSSFIDNELRAKENGQKNVDSQKDKANENTNIKGNSKNTTDFLNRKKKEFVASKNEKSAAENSYPSKRGGHNDHGFRGNKINRRISRSHEIQEVQDYGVSNISNSRDYVVPTVSENKRELGRNHDERVTSEVLNIRGHNARGSFTTRRGRGNQAVYDHSNVNRGRGRGRGRRKE